MNGLQKKIAGFTVLELLVVIAIIGVLAAVALTFLNESRRQGRDAGVKSNLVNARSEAALHYSSSGNVYAGLCTNATIRRMIQTAARSVQIVPNPGAYLNTDNGDWDTEICHASGQFYVIWVPMSDSASGAATGWCIDATGTSSKKTFTTGNAVLGGDFDCQ